MAIRAAYNWVVGGHDSAKKLLERFLVSGHVPHAILLWGEAGIGKLALAQEFAAQLLNVSSISQSLDYLFFDIAETGSVEAARGLLAQLPVAPYTSKYRVVLINHFDQASVAVANLFLKTLEEPPDRTIILLVADSRDVLPTIWSRVQAVPLHAEHVSAPKSDSDAQWVQKFSTTLTAPLADKVLFVGELAELEADQLGSVLLAWLRHNTELLRTEPAIWPRVATALSVYQDFTTMPGLNKKLVLGRLVL